MTIYLADLAAKKVKSTPEVTISDHTLTINSVAPDNHELIFTGKGTRGLVIKNAKGAVTFHDCAIDNSSTGVTVKFDGKYDKVKISGSGSTKLFGKAGNSASQVLYLVGTWSNVEIGGFEIDQRRDDKTGSTTTGAAFQLAGVLSSTHNLGDVHIHDMIVHNAGDEANYDNHFSLDGGYATGENLTVENFKVFGSGRDFLQQWGFKNVIYRNCYGENGGKEANPDHCSALSMNGYTETMLIENCDFKNVAQLIYSGAPKSGKTIQVTLKNVKYEQGTHAGARNNSAAYLKGPGTYHFQDCEINAPNVLQAAITADGCAVTYSNCKIVAKDVDRLFNGGTVKELPSITLIDVTAQLETTTINMVTTEVLIYDGKRFPL